LPEQALWVFSGTSDGNRLANELAQQGYPVVVSAATEYGGEVATQHCSGVSVWAGHQGVEAQRQALSQHQAWAIVDATHPYASLISKQLMDLAQSLAIPYLRYERPSSFAADSGIECDSTEQAANQAIALGSRIFLTTGSKDLAVFLQAPGATEREWFVRLTPEPEFIQRAIDLGVPRSHICAMQGPFSEAFNTAWWRDLNIDCVISKDSGDAGGYHAKVAATEALSIPLLVIKRPKLDYPVVTSTFDALLRQLQTWNITA
jgi:precorrin-6x reductase